MGWFAGVGRPTRSDTRPAVAVAALANRQREPEPADRLDEIAELYLEVTDMDTAEVALAFTAAGVRAAQRLPG